MSAPHKPPQLRLERRLWAAGCRYVAGVDEAGRGAWAGPVVAAAVILPADRKDLRRQLEGVLDSKLLSSSQRAKLAVLIRATAVAVGVGGAGPMEIDRDGILPATRAAMQRAIAALRPRPRHLLVDAVDLRALVALPQQRMNHGEHASLSIAAASIIAKVARDEMMKVCAVVKQPNRFGIGIALGLEDAGGEGVAFEDRDGALDEPWSAAARRSPPFSWNHDVDQPLNGCWSVG